ncbi:kinase [Neobacillus sp. D3-1R]|uniref:kinase n=1 Tax=Neobacillus sp. D3-1R TaxID=3445778 RepID=UPI003FA0C3DB
MDIVTKIPKFEKGKRLILAIDGLSRSGKTTLVKELGKYWDETNTPYHIFHIDDHIEERSKRYHTGYEEWFEYYSLQWDVNGLRECFFEKLSSHAELSLPFYQADTDTQTIQTVQLPKEGIIVIEGVFLQRKEWRDYFDFVVYLDCPRDSRFLRESKETQQNLTKFQNRYWKAEDYYLKTEEPIGKADLVL